MPRWAPVAEVGSGGGVHLLGVEAEGAGVVEECPLTPAGREGGSRACQCHGGDQQPELMERLVGALDERRRLPSG